MSENLPVSKQAVVSRKRSRTEDVDESPLTKQFRIEQDLYHEMHLRTQITDWIENKINERNFRFRDIPKDMFLYSHEKNRVLIRDMFEERIKNHVRFQLKPVINLPKFGDWRDEVINWYNSWCAPSVDAFKKPHLYLWGKPDYGKTVFIRELLLRGVDKKSIFIPCFAGNRRGYLNDRSWKELNYGIHCLVLKDQFSIDTNFNNGFKSLLQGTETKYQAKHKHHEHVKANVPMFFLTNYEFPARDDKKLKKMYDSVGYDEMRSCFTIIEACGIKYSYDAKVFPYKDLMLNCPPPYEAVKSEPL